MEQDLNRHESSSDRNAIEVLAEEFVERYRTGERPPLSEYTSRYPEFEAEIVELFPALLLMENLKPVEDDLAGQDQCLAPEFRQIGIASKTTSMNVIVSC